MGINETIGRLVVEIGADIKDFKDKMSQAEAEVDASTKAMEANLKRLGAAMVAIGGAITAFAAVSVKDFAKTGDMITELSQRTGMSTEWLSKMSYVADLTGSSIEGLTTSSRLLSQQLIQASDGSKEAQASFKTLGLSYQQLRAMSPEEQFEAVLKALGNVSDETERAALAMQVFGRAGVQMLPMIADGADGLEEMMQKAEELGAVMSKEDIEAANKLQDSLDNVQASMKGLKNTVAEALAPALTKLADLVSGLIGSWNRWADANPALARTIVEITVALGALLLVGGTILILLPHLAAGFATLGISIQLLTGPIGWAILAVTALAAAFVYLYNTTDEANRRFMTSQKQALNETLKNLQKERQAIQETYLDSISAIQEERAAKLEAVEDQQKIAQIYYEWRLSRIEADRDAAIKAIEDEADKARAAYDVQRKAAEESSLAEVREIERVRDAKIAALQDQLDAIDKAALADEKGQIQARKREIERELEVVQTEETRQELLAEYGDLDRDLTRIARQEKRDAIQEQMDDIRNTAQVDIAASQEKLAAEITRLDTTLATALANSDTAKAQAEADYQSAKTNLEALISTSLTGTDAERLAVTAKWTEEMKGALDFQTQWRLDHDARIKGINDEADAAIAAAKRVQEELTKANKEQIDAVTEQIENLPSGSKGFWATLGQGLANFGTTTADSLASALSAGANAIGNVGGSIGNAFGMASGGAGVVTEPTLFLAGEAGPEAFAFGPAAQAQGNVFLKIEINGGVYTGTPEGAQILAEELAPSLRRIMRANAGEAQW